MKIYTVPDFLERKIEQILKHSGTSLKESKKLAECVLRMSDYYIANPDSQTPWHENWCQIAQAAYFLPLNFIRAQYVIEEAQRLNFFKEFRVATEVGYGLGALTLHLQKIFKDLSGLEISQQSQKLFSLISEGALQIKNKIPHQDGQLLAFSYSLTEAISVKELASAQGVLIIEPSTHQDARELQKLRQTLMEKGFYSWAPCTHQGGCPLLIHSQKDWCHHRIHTNMPDWFLEMEKQLPFKNKTLTLSYLLMSKNPPPVTGSQTRIIGDILIEKGKSKALICRSEEREFLSVLHKVSKDFPYERGDSVTLPEAQEKKGNEIRILPIE